MALTIRVIYENGVLRPLEPISLDEGQEATVTIENSQPDITRAELKEILKDLDIRWSNPDDNRDAWVEDLADEIAEAFKGLPSVSEIIIEERNEGR